MGSVFGTVIRGLFILLLLVMVSAASAEMVVTTKDGRKFTVPVESGDVRRIEYVDSQAPAGNRELIGTWSWVAGQTLVIRENGSLEVFDGSGARINDGRWEVLDAGGRKYRFTHRVGGWVDTVVLSADGRSLDGTNNHGSTIHGAKR
jgi:hypothetical protein